MLQEFLLMTYQSDSIAFLRPLNHARMARSARRLPACLTASSLRPMSVGRGPHRRGALLIRVIRVVIAAERAEEAVADLVASPAQRPGLFVPH